jgi:hypothetical protein
VFVRRPLPRLPVSQRAAPGRKVSLHAVVLRRVGRVVQLVR